jgi:rod shape-determining protein MreC
MIAIVCGITLLFVILIAASAPSGSPIHGIYKVFASPVSVVQNAFSSLGHKVKSGFTLLFHADSVNEELEQLREENAALNDAAMKNQILERENEELKGMLDFQKKYTEFNVVGAEIIAGDVSEMFHTFTINCGTSDGIEEGSFVVTAQGLAGVVHTAGPISSKVISIVDEQNKIIARTMENNEMLRVTGTYADEGGSYLKVDRILDNAEIHVGDTLVTSNSGDIYPYGIKVGVITEIGVNEASGTRYAIAEPAVNLRTVSRVFVMTPKKDASDILNSDTERQDEG